MTRVPDARRGPRGQFVPICLNAAHRSAARKCSHRFKRSPGNEYKATSARTLVMNDIGRAGRRERRPTAAAPSARRATAASAATAVAAAATTAA